MAGSFYGNPHFQLQIVDVFGSQESALAKLDSNEILEGQYCVIFESSNPFIDGAIFKKVLKSETDEENDTIITTDNSIFAYLQITKIKGDPGFLDLLGKFPTLNALIEAADDAPRPYGVAGCVDKGNNTYVIYACLPADKTPTIPVNELQDETNWVELNYTGINDNLTDYEHTWSSKKIQEEYTGIDHINDIEFGKIEGARIPENVNNITSLSDLQNYVWSKVNEEAETYDVTFDPLDYYWFIENVGYYWYDPSDSANSKDENVIKNNNNWRNFQEGYNDYHIVGENEALLKHHKHGYLTTYGKLVDIEDSHFQDNADSPVMPDLGEDESFQYATEVPVRTDEYGNIIGETDVPQFNHITGQLDGQITVNGTSIQIICEKKPNIVNGGIITGILQDTINDKSATVDVIYNDTYYAYGNLFVYNNTVGFDNNALRAGQILMLYIKVNDNIGEIGEGSQNNPIYNNCEFHVINPQSMYEHSHYISSIKDIESGTWYPAFYALEADGTDIASGEYQEKVDNFTNNITSQTNGWYTRVGNTVTIGFQCKGTMGDNYRVGYKNQIGIKGLPYKCVSRAGGGGIIYKVLQRLNNNDISGKSAEMPYVSTSFYISAGEGVTNGAENTITVRRTPVGNPLNDGAMPSGLEAQQRLANLSVCYYPDAGTTFFLYGTICYQTDSSWSKINNVALDNEGGDSAYDQVSTLLAKLEQAEQRIGLLSSQVETILKNYGISSHN